MDEFKIKSEFNKAAANLLLNNQLYAPSVHCSYYMCVQLMLHILFHKKKIQKADFDSDMKKRRDGTHGHAIYLIGLDLIKIEKDSYKRFQALIPKLKEYREKSDYTDQPVLQQMGYDAYQKLKQ